MKWEDESITAEGQKDSMTVPAANIVNTALVGHHPGSLGYLSVCAVRSWSGLEKYKHIVAFGDSYTSGANSGDPVSVNGHTPWVEHLLRSLNNKYMPYAILYNYAQPGNTVQEDLAYQLSRYFVDFPKKNTPASNPSLPPAETVYIFWFGVNDCGNCLAEEINDIPEILFDALHDLYVKAGARNFLLVDVPPLERTPGATDVTIDLRENCRIWNENLVSQCTEFARESAMANVFLFSSHALFTDILDDPTLYDFTEDDAEQMDGAIWEDGFHPTQEMHVIIAKSVEEGLSCIQVPV